MPRREAPSAPPLGELLNEREAEGVRLGEWNRGPVLPRAPLKGLAAVAAWAAYRCLMQSWSWQIWRHFGTDKSD